VTAKNPLRSIYSRNVGKHSLMLQTMYGPRYVFQNNHGRIDFYLFNAIMATSQRVNTNNAYTAISASDLPALLPCIAQNPRLQRISAYRKKSVKFPPDLPFLELTNEH